MRVFRRGVRRHYRRGGSLRASPDQRDALAALLAEQSPLYAGRSTGDAERLRSYLLASFELMGLPASAMPFVIEELESGLNPYVVAAAAKRCAALATSLTASQRC